MAKNNPLKKYTEELHDDFDFSEDMESPSDEALAGMMGGIIEASQHQQIIAIELTKLVVGKTAEEKINEDKVFSIFKQASKVVSENFPLKELWEKLSK